MPRSMGTRCGVKITSTGVPAARAQDLLDLRRVAVPADVVGRDALVALGVVGRQLGRAPGPGDAALGVDDDVPSARSARPSAAGPAARMAEVG